MSTGIAHNRQMVWWWPIMALVFYGLTSLQDPARAVFSSPFAAFLAIGLLPVLFGTVFAAVYHSEVIAVRTGEPYGTLVLTVAVTIIEVALITSVMAGDKGNAALARDSVFAVVMLVCNGLVGLCIVIGGIHHHEQNFRVRGASSYLMVIMTLAVLTMVMPNYTQSLQGPYYTTPQLIFVSLATVALYAAFLYNQTVRHRDHFVLVLDADETDGPPPELPDKTVAASCAFLIISLTVVVLLAKKFAALLDIAIVAAAAPASVAGIVVALLVLLPEAIAAVTAARRNQLQKSINLALGSTLATIGLTIPAVAVVSILLGRGLVLGLDQKDTVLLVLTFAVSLLTFATGRTNILAGYVHLVLMLAFVFLVFVP